VSAPGGSGARSTLDVGGESYEILARRAQEVRRGAPALRLKVLLESLLRNGEDEGAEAVARWSATDERSQEIA
jgi:aconitase A